MGWRMRRGCGISSSALPKGMKAEAHRLGYEMSEDALSWNVFASLAVAGRLREAAQYLTGRPLRSKPSPYLWGRHIDLQHLVFRNHAPCHDNRGFAAERKRPAFMARPGHGGGESVALDRNIHSPRFRPLMVTVRSRSSPRGDRARAGDHEQREAVSEHRGAAASALAMANAIRLARRATGIDNRPALKCFLLRAARRQRGSRVVVAFAPRPAGPARG